MSMPPEKDVPRRIAAIRRKNNGDIDEIIAPKPDLVHLEQMTESSWWLGIERDGYRQVVRFSAEGPIHTESEMDDWPGDGAPTAQEVARFRALSARQRVGLTPTEFVDMISISTKMKFAQHSQVDITGVESELLKDLRALATKHKLD